MANEITFSATIRVANGSFNLTRQTSNTRADQTTQGGGGPGTVITTTTESSVVMTGYGFVWMQNLDATNFVQIGFAAGVYNLKLRAGAAPTMLELDGTQTLYLKSDTADCNVDIVGINL
jgi:hypothetical protein